MINTIHLRWLYTLICGIVFFGMLIGCGSKDTAKEVKKHEYQRKLNEARELAKKIRDGDVFDEREIIKQKILNPKNVCSIGADLAANDFGPSPDFRSDGKSVVYADKSTTVYYYFIPNRQSYKLDHNARNPSFGMFTGEEATQKYIYEYFTLRKNSWEGDSHGIRMNTEVNWLKDAILITEEPAEHPYLVNNDKEIIYMRDGEYYVLDDAMISKKITKNEYDQLRDSRYNYEQSWKTASSYRGISGVWITDAEEKNWCQLRSLQNIQTIDVIPSSYNIYFWGKRKAGMCFLKPLNIQQYTIQLIESAQISTGDLFDVYEKETSPISHEIIGYQKDKLKGTLRVINTIGTKLICEYQTRLHKEAIFAKDAAVARKDQTILGSIL